MLVVVRVRIRYGNTALGPDDAPLGTDVAVMGDFIYGEPQAVPEPAENAIATLAIAGFTRRLRKR